MEFIPPIILNKPGVGLRKELTNKSKLILAGID